MSFHWPSVFNPPAAEGGVMDDWQDLPVGNRTVMQHFEAQCFWVDLDAIEFPGTIQARPSVDRDVLDLRER